MKKRKWVTIGDSLMEGMTYLQGNWRFQLHLLAKHCDLMGYARTMRMNHYRKTVSEAASA